MLTRRRLVGTAATLLLGLMVPAGLVACDGSSADELAVREAVNQTMAAYTAENVSAVESELLGETTLTELSEYGIDSEELLRRCLENLTYEVGDVSVDGSSATVTLEVTNVDASSAMNSASSRFEAYADTDAAEEAFEESGEAALMTKLFDYLLEALESSADLVTTTVEVTCTKDDAGSWTCSLADNPSLKAAILGQTS